MKKIYLTLLCVVSFVFASCASFDYETFKAISEAVKTEEESLNASNSKKAEKIEDTGAKAERLLAIEKSVMNAVENLGPQEEYIIGRAVSSSILGKYKLYENRAANEYLNKVLGVIVRNSDNPYLYKGYFAGILDTDEVNAISSPGGHVFVTRGLLKKTKSEDEVAAVVAHELSHIQLGHAMQAIRTSRVMDASMKIMDEINYEKKEYSKDEISAYNETRTEIVSTLVESGFSKTQEYNADANAIKLMAASGYDPECLIELLETLESNSSEKGWSKTHPKPEDRIKKSQSKLKKINFDGESKEVRQKRFNAAKVSF